MPCLQAWAKSLGDISFPLLSDFYPHGAIAEKYGVLRPEGYSERAIFIIDKEGIIQYIDIHDIDDQPDNDVLFAELQRIAPQDFAAFEQRKPQGEDGLPKGGVVLYCTHWCPACRRARLWLENNNIDFVEVNIDRNPAADRQVRAWADGNRTTPTFDINGTVVVNFDQKRLEELLLNK